MRHSRIVAVLSLVAVGLSGCATGTNARYEMVSASTDASMCVYRLDTWTGEIHWISANAASAVEGLPLRKLE